MIKVIGALLIIGTSTIAGFFYAQKFGERCRLIKLWLRILDIFRTEIYFQANPLREVFLKTATLIDDRYFSNAFNWLATSLVFGSDQDLEEAWNRFLTETGSGILEKNDILILRELGSYLGTTDRDDQLEKIKNCRANLEINLQSAEAERNKRTGLYRYLGFAMGALLVLWLI